jgi:hypothetical protein
MTEHSHPTVHRPFDSIYRENFEVVEERHEAVRLYPHSEQLPALARALRWEFHAGLPHHIAGVDHRADAFHKIMRRLAAMMFCNVINEARADQVRLHHLVDRNLVTEASIVQQITVETKQGLLHRFRFYASDDFVPEIFLSGRRVLFTDHVLQRFSKRVPNAVGGDLSDLLLRFFGTPHVAMKIGPGYAFVLLDAGSVLAFPFKETETEFILTTCLTVDEINSLEMDFPPRAFNLHYDRAFTVPRIRHWLPTRWMIDRHQSWQRKTRLPPWQQSPNRRWSDLGHWIKDHIIKQGHGPGSKIMFGDHIPGPCVLEVRPNSVEARYNELKAYKKMYPDKDWDAIFAERERPIPS